MASIILASQSPRRKQLLEWAEIPFDILVKPTAETFPPGLTHDQAAIHIAREKAVAVQDAAAGRTIIAADTIVVVENDIIGKPADRDDAVKILGRLSGQSHKVITGVVIRQGEKEIAFADTTEVDFHIL